MFIVEAAVREPPSNLDAGVAESAIGVFQREKIFITASASAVRAGLFTSARVKPPYFLNILEMFQ